MGKVSGTKGEGRTSNGQRLKIVGNDTGTLAVEANWTTQPTAASKHSIELEPVEGSFEMKAEENETVAPLPGNQAAPTGRRHVAGGVSPCHSPHLASRPLDARGLSRRDL